MASIHSEEDLAVPESGVTAPLDDELPPPADEDACKTDITKNKKRKVVLYVAYVGAGYAGMQANPGMTTIESVLEAAIHRAGGISKDNAGDFAKSHWMRAARTDKGVSAVGQVVSLKMAIGEPDIIEKINEELPKEIRVLGYTRVTRAFDARLCCDNRRYEYILPAFAFDPTACLNRTDLSEEAVKEQLAVAGASEDSAGLANGGTACNIEDSIPRPPPPRPILEPQENGHAKPDASGLEQPGGAACKMEDSTVFFGQPFLPDAPQSHEKTASSLERPISGSKLSEASAMDSFQPVSGDTDCPAGVPEEMTDKAKTKNGSAAAEVTDKAQATDELKDQEESCNQQADASTLGLFHFDEACRAKLNSILKQYEGTHSFHNFTPKMDATDPSAKRYILSFSCPSTFQIQGKQWVRMVVTGQSFMLHQIRKMVGVAVAIARGVAPANAIHLALDRSRSLITPMAPAVGLFLDESLFGSYNHRWGEEREECVGLERFKEQIAEFKKNQLYPQIAAQDGEEEVTLKWLKGLNERNWRFSEWEKAPLTDLRKPRSSTGAPQSTRGRNRTERPQRGRNPGRFQGAQKRKSQGAQYPPPMQKPRRVYDTADALDPTSAAAKASMDAEWSD